MTAQLRQCPRWFLLVTVMVTACVSSKKNVQEDAAQPPKRIRFEQLTTDKLNDKQKALAEEIAKNAKKAGLGGPFNLLLRDPDMLAALNGFSNYMRFNTSLPPKYCELVTMVQARFWKAQFLWWAHYPIAIKAGLDAAAIENIKQGQYPNSLQNDEKAVYRATVEISRYHNLTDRTFWWLRKYLNEKQMADFVALNGLHTMIGMVLNVSDAQIPGGEAPPLPAVPHVLPLK